MASDGGVLMAATEVSWRVYEQLADLCAQHQEAGRRDLFLLLAADAALAQGQAEVAERCRRRLLQVSPHNLLRPFHSLSEALLSDDVQDYLADLRRQYPLAQAAQLLARHQPTSATTATVRLSGDGDATMPAKAWLETPKPAQPAAAQPQPANSRSPGSTQVQSIRPNKTAALAPPPAPSGSLGFLLFLLVLLLGLGWLVFAFLRPFIGH